jgi:hypothetical protein
MSEHDIRFALICPRRIRGRLIRNASYGGPSVALNGWHWHEAVSKSAKPGFHSALREDIRTNGVRNPVLVWSLPEGIFLTFGGSRVVAAIAAGLDTIPAIINDYTGEFAEEQLVTRDNYSSFFRDTPRTFDFGPDGADYHYHLERARRHEHDDAGLAWLEGTSPDWLSKEFPWISDTTDE